MDINKIVQEVVAEIGARTYEARPAETREVCAYDVPGMLEHSLLVPDITMDKILEECSNARRYDVAAVCVAPYFVSAAADALQGSGVAVCAAIGFPHASMSAAAKLAEAKECMNNGADELDVALNMSAIKSGSMCDARADLDQIVKASLGRAKVKAVFEHCVYTDEEKQAVLNMIKDCGAEYIKIQNVLSGKGADVADIRYVKNILGRNIKIKIDGGVKTLEKACELIAGGADRIGLTATVAIAKEAYAAK